MEEEKNAQPVAETGTQVCKECGRTLPLEDFQRRRYGKRDKVCKACRAEKIRVGMATGKEKKVDIPEKKPAEWSDEDKDMLNSCISSIEEAKENRYAYKETDGDTSYDHEIAWLKSLRPSWKPFEEPVVILKTADFSDAALLEELRRRGYKGTITKVQEVEI